jgi:hypothetical protein
LATVLRKSYLTVAQCNLYLKDSPLKGFGAVFLKAEADTGIAADLMMAICKQESNLGRHNWSKAPYHNCTNWGIGDVTVTGEGRFASFTECITNTFKWVKERHLNPSNWRYKKAVAAKLDPLSIEGVALNYASDKGWPAAINRIQKEILGFMPEEVSVKQEAVAKLKLVEPVDWNAPVSYLVYAWILHKGGMNG